MGGKVDLAEATLSDQAAESVVADLSKIRRGELGQKRLVGVGKLVEEYGSARSSCLFAAQDAPGRLTFLRWSCSSYSACVLAGGICAYSRMLFRRGVCRCAVASNPFLHVVGISWSLGGSLVAGGDGGGS